MCDTNHLAVPDDFPRLEQLGSVTGAQPKLLVRQADDGSYVAGETPDELYARYDNCQDLVRQLVGYFYRKKEKYPEMSQIDLLKKIEISIRTNTEWGLFPAEKSWILAKFMERINAAS